jgi:hypothetical protein
VRKTLLATTIIAVGALALSATGALSAPHKAGDHAANPLVGTWVTSVTLTNPPAGVDGTFQGLDTFVAGGGIIVSSSQSHPTQRSLAHGNYTRTGDRQYACSFVWFRFDPTGAFAGMQRVRRTMTVSRDGTSFQAEDTIDVLAPNGTVVATIQGTETGQRLGL